ncbi:MAG: tetratricopeptide repeat protein [Chloroflexota bacterium]
MPETNPSQLVEDGKRAFEKKRFDQAANLFRQAAEAYIQTNDHVSAAEAQNNLSVALLQAGKPQEALTAALGTDEVFAGIDDLKRQGMAFGNQAAALEALDRYEEAIALYERSAEIFDRAGEGDLRAMVKKSAAALQLRKGKITDSALKMIGALEAKEKPSFFERILKFFLRTK